MYVCSKPLQYFNVINLPKDKIQKNILIIEDKFKDAQEFFAHVVKFDKSWNEILFIKDRSKILWFCLFKYKINNFYYYLDFMLKASSLLYIVPCKHLFIYEEGIGAYRTDIFKNTATYRIKIRKLLGLSEYPGFHPRSEGIYVYDKERYLKIFSKFRDETKLKPLVFNMPFQKMINDNVDLALKIFDFNPDIILSGITNKKVFVYLTTWPLYENVLRDINMTKYDYCIIKPHPHIRELDFPDWWKNDKTIIIESVILAEFLIKILIDRNNLLDIYHHNSSAAMYLNGLKNINTIVSLPQVII